jgi:hypothetical protein
MSFSLFGDIIVSFKTASIFKSFYSVGDFPEVSIKFAGIKLNLPFGKPTPNFYLALRLSSIFINATA